MIDRAALFILRIRLAALSWRANAADRHADHCADVFNGAVDYADRMHDRVRIAHRALMRRMHGGDQ
jgi:hypothetical protein